MVNNQAPKPYHLMLALNNLCNYKCIFCVNDKIVNRGYLTLKKVLELSDLIDTVELVDITGYGEIMMHPNFKELVLMLSGKNKPFSISTNGSHLSKSMINFLDDSTLDLLNISLNSLNFDTYKKITGTGDLSQVLTNIGNLFETKRKYKITLSMVITALTIGEMSDFINFARTCRVHRVRFLPLTPNISNYPEEILVKDTPQNREFLLKAEELALRHLISIQSFSFDPAVTTPPKKKSCNAPFNQICINQNGNITPCCWLSTMIMGNIKDNTWQDIWQNEKYADLRRSVEIGDLKYCKDCREFG